RYELREPAVEDAVDEGRIRGVIVIRGRPTTWGEEEQRLVMCFAHELGAALERGRTRERLDADQSRHALSRGDLIDRGAELLQVCPQCRRCFDHQVRRCPEDGATLKTEGVLPYRVMGRYRLVKVIGQGGMGTVYEAHDQRLGRVVAIKIIRAEYFRDVNVRLRFRQEARAIARISHPGVIALYDTGELPDGSAFLVMEKLVGLDLADMIDHYGPGTPAQVAALMRQAGAALAAAHRADLVHRDIKPENIFLVDGTGGFLVKILDFGLAKSMSLETTNLTQTGVVMGTPVYMSPEQIQGKDLDARSDLYSFASVCYEALTGRRVVESEEFAKVCAEVLHREPPPLRGYVREIPRRIERAFMRALAKDRDKRHAKIEDWVRSFVDELALIQVPHRGWPEQISAPEPEDSTAHVSTLAMAMANLTGEPAEESGPNKRA
ncbi:MAG: serine/threonine protein kinase, partial [Myxococcales bacterium]|nr:serine/threonine protein kinase [Myxococcales bacterium]